MNKIVSFDLIELAEQRLVLAEKRRTAEEKAEKEKQASCTHGEYRVGRWWYDCSCLTHCGCKKARKTCVACEKQEDISDEVYWELEKMGLLKKDEPEPKPAVEPPPPVRTPWYKF